MYPVKKNIILYAEKLVRGVHEKQIDLDETIAEVLENWTPDRIGYVERAVLRIALFEMLYCDDVPASVAINEGIEVAKSFGSEEAPRFINGVLDRLREHLQSETK
jgi:N utilization substance protein B